RTKVTVAVSPCRTTVGTEVARSSNTGHTGAPTSAFTSMLLPCLNSPTTRTRTCSSTSRFLAARSRARRSGRSWRSRAVRARSTACTGAEFVTAAPSDECVVVQVGLVVRHVRLEVVGSVLLGLVHGGLVHRRCVPRRVGHHRVVHRHVHPRGGRPPP